MLFQNTRLERGKQIALNMLSSSVGGNWRRRSLGLLSLLIGFYAGSSLTVYYLQEIGQRPLVALTMVIFMELLVRLRTRVNRKPWPMLWLILDNLRIGAIYSVILEAFKLGS
uniref:DUF565 domain-containing protein n=1 Tax=Paulinella chromatophora TaxID=39717 RepID=B1X5P4_PAUCH|nr:hypothetical protein PCC_0853 [Paulinella chromatophora]ACB43263.1 hypothetical protein PCC_0853 [Paulinella chromatophora]